MTHLRKMMLEELQRLNYSAETIRSSSTLSKIFLDDSSAARTAWVLGTFANIRPSCFTNVSCRRIASRFVWQP